MRIRVRLAAETMASPELISQWADDVPEDPVSMAEEREVQAVVTALCAGPYPEFGGVGLRAVLDFGPGRLLADQTVTALLQGAELSPDMDMRCLLAAATLAFGRQPQRYLDRDITTTVLEHATVIETKGVRAARRRSAQRADRQRRAGHEVFDILVS